MQMRSIGIGVMIAALVLGALVAGSMAGTSAYFNRAQVTGSHTLSTWQCILWLQTTQADFQTDTGVNVSTSASPGNVTLARQTIAGSSWGSMYGLTGDSDPTFSLYNPSTNSWTGKADAPDDVSYGGALAYAGDGTIYALQGGWSNAFWRYNISTNTWSAKADAPGFVSDGGALAYAGDGNMYAFRGGGFSDAFWRYNISTNTWTTKADAPGLVNFGGALAYAGDGTIYALQGGWSNAFWQYRISTNTWTTKADTPGLVGYGGALASTGDGNMYALQGGYTTSFWRYNISTNTWSPKASTGNPGSVGSGGALAYTGDGNIYAQRGGVPPGGGKEFMYYNISADRWTKRANTPLPVSWGGSLAYVPTTASGYPPAGNLSSGVSDSGKAGTAWNPLIWSGTTNPNVTNITFQVRASDTFFSPDAASPSWVTVSWPSPVTTGLPTGRYFQWRATLTTTDSGQTPVLSDVSLCYS